MAIKASGHENYPYTVVLACCVDGTHLTPILIFKRKTFSKEKLPGGVLVHVHANARMGQDGKEI